jgi:hypothetical protein
MPQRQDPQAYRAIPTLVDLATIGHASEHAALLALQVLRGFVVQNGFAVARAVGTCLPDVLALLAEDDTRTMASAPDLSRHAVAASLVHALATCGGDGLRKLLEHNAATPLLLRCASDVSGVVHSCVCAMDEFARRLPPGRALLLRSGAVVILARALAMFSQRRDSMATTHTAGLLKCLVARMPMPDWGLVQPALPDLVRAVQLSDAPAVAPLVYGILLQYANNPLFRLDVRVLVFASSVFSNSACSRTRSPFLCLVCCGLPALSRFASPR